MIYHQPLVYWAGVQSPFPVWRLSYECFQIVLLHKNGRSPPSKEKKKAPGLFRNRFQYFNIQVCIRLDCYEKVLHIVLWLKKIPHLYFYWKAGTLLNVRIIRTFTNGNEVSLLFCLSLYRNIHIHTICLILMNYTETLVLASRISLT